MLLPSVNRMSDQESEAQISIPHLTRGQKGLIFPYFRIDRTICTVRDLFDFDLGIFSHADEISISLWAYKKRVEVPRQMSLHHGAVERFHHPFPGELEASLRIVDRNIRDMGRAEIGHIEYSEDRDIVILKFLRMNVNIVRHGLGTSIMKPLHKSGVTDMSLNLRGVHGLEFG